MSVLIVINSGFFYIFRKLRDALYNRDDEILCDLKIEKLCGKDAYLNPIYIAYIKEQSLAKVSCLLGYDHNRMNELIIEGPFQDPQELTVEHVLNKHCLIPSSSLNLVRLTSLKCCGIFS